MVVVITKIVAEPMFEKPPESMEDVYGDGCYSPTLWDTMLHKNLPKFPICR